MLRVRTHIIINKYNYNNYKTKPVVEKNWITLIITEGLKQLRILQRLGSMSFFKSKQKRLFLTEERLGKGKIR